MNIALLDSCLNCAPLLLTKTCHTAPVPWFEWACTLLLMNVHRVSNLEIRSLNLSALKLHLLNIQKDRFTNLWISYEKNPKTTSPKSFCFVLFLFLYPYVWVWYFCFCASFFITWLFCSQVVKSELCEEIWSLSICQKNVYF